jgi:truncated hemoglobin YjbI
MQKALADMPIGEDRRQKLIRAFMATADHMRNQPELGSDDRLPIIRGE